MAYRLAKALIQLRDDINAAAPDRSRISDGWIGDAAHSSRTSDHNPDKDGVVKAIDITNDPAHAVDGNKIAAAAIKDTRVKYVIWNRRIWNTRGKEWRPYSGKNPHDHHVHVSVLPDKAHYDDTTSWKVDAGIEAASKVAAEAPPVEEKQILKLGSQGGDVIELQQRLGVKADGDFGPKTEAAVKKFQKENGLAADGVVGQYTWEALEKNRPVPVPLMAVPPADEEIGTPAGAISKLQRLGWNKAAAIALVANLIWESGGHDKIVWNAVGDAGHSHGAGQWNDRHGRWQALEQFARTNERSVDDPETQLEFMDQELRSTERNVGSRLTSVKSVGEAMKIALDYWRPGTPHADRRRAIAAKLEEKYDA